MKVLKIIDCKDDYKYQGPRYIKLGPNSGEEFRDTYLIPWINENEQEKEICLDFEGTIVYTPSFLEESIGGSLRMGYAKVAQFKFINIPDDEKIKVLSYVKKNKKVK